MHISVAEALPVPADVAFHLLRDRMPELVPFLHDVESITVVERQDGDGTVRILNLWQGSMDKVPAPARPFVTPELISWHDHATWTTARMEAAYRLEPRIGARIFTCAGTTRVVAAGAEHSELRIEVDLDVYPDRVPGVPKLLARRLRGPIEQTIAGQVRPNLEGLAGSIRAWAQATGAAR